MIKTHYNTFSTNSFTQSSKIWFQLIDIDQNFLNQEDKDLIDFSLSKKVLLCSPITLYAVLSLIRQAVSNFAMEQKAGEMQDLVVIFRKQWEQFSEKVQAMGKSISALSNHYDDLKGPRFRALEKPMEKINELQLGQDSKGKSFKE